MSKKIGQGFTVKALYPPPTVTVSHLIDYKGDLVDLEPDDQIHLRRFMNDGLSSDHITMEVYRGANRLNFWTRCTIPDNDNHPMIKQDAVIIVHKTSADNLLHIINHDHILDRFFNAKISTEPLPPGVHDDPGQMIGVKIINIEPTSIKNQ